MRPLRGPGERVMKVRPCPSPNCGARREGALPDAVVLHYTAMPETRAVLDWLADEKSQVSAHYVVSPEGELWQMVEEAERAWHAGASRWGECQDVNSRSIGIEIVNSAREPFSEPQMRAVEALLRGAMSRWSILPERVLGHSDVAPGRKIDPGPRFDWRRLALQGLSVWSEAAEEGRATEAQFLRDARAFGYTADVAPDILLSAFRARFRPGASGPLAAQDCARIADLAARFPVAAPLS